MNRATGFTIGCIPEIRIDGSDDPSSGLVNKRNHFCRGLPGSDYIAVLVSGKDKSHSYPWGFKINPQDKDMLHLIIRGLEVNVGFIDSCGKKECRIRIYMGDASCF